MPQGSILGQLLFIIYVNDISNCLKHCKTEMFADDTAIYTETDTIEEAMEQMNEDLNILYKKICENKLKLNIDKTKTMIFGNRMNTYNNEILIKINEKKVEIVDKIKYLGVVVDNKLGFSSNIDHICNKIGMQIIILNRLRNELNCTQKITIYKSVIEPHFIYSASILFLSTQGDMNRHQKLTSGHILLEILNFMSVKQIIIFHTMIFVHKIINGRAPPYL